MVCNFETTHKNASNVIRQGLQQCSSIPTRQYTSILGLGKSQEIKQNSAVLKF